MIDANTSKSCPPSVIFHLIVLTPTIVLYSRSVFAASIGRGLMFCGDRWDSVVVEDQTSRKLTITAMAALGSFGCSTPHFWMNLLTVFSCSISLGLSMSLRSLEKGVAGGTAGSLGGVLKSMNLVTLVTLVTLLGQVRRPRWTAMVILLVVL